MLVAAVLIAPLLLGCEPAPPWNLEEDLARSFEFAEVKYERAMIDLGTPAARSHLLAGWSWDAAAGDGTSYVWAEGRRSEVEVFLGFQRPLEIRFRCLAFTFPGAPRQQLEILWDEHALGAFTVGGGFSETAVSLPAELATAGSHRLSLVPTYAEQPSRVSASGDVRELSFGCDWIRIGEDRDVEMARADEQTLWLPVGAQVAYFFEPDGARRLDWQSMAARGAARGLVAEWAVEGGTADSSELEAPSTGGVELPLASAVPQPARLILRPQADGWGGGVVLRNPVLSAPPAKDQPVEDRPVAETAGEPPSESIGRPPILVWVVDTLRTDRLGLYGHPRPTSPHFDALAARSTVFERAMAQSSWTRPTMATLVTGVGPEKHGIHSVDHGLSPSFETLAEVLSRAGYATGGFSTNGNFSPDTQLDQGFEHFEYVVSDAERLVEHAGAWLEGLAERGDSRPPLLMMLTAEPHASFEPKAPYRQRLAPEVTDPWIGTSEHLEALGERKSLATDEVVAQLFELYDGEIAWNDAVFGRFREQLSAKGLDPLIVVIADHGEAFRERGVFGHGWDLHSEVLDVPFWIHLPGQLETRRVEDPVQQSDLLPTLLDVLGLPVPDGVEGRSLRPYLDGAQVEPDPARLLISTMDYEGRAAAALIRGRYKLIEPRSAHFSGGRLLYDRLDDPTELRNLAAERPILAGLLARLLRQALAERRGSGADEVELDPETRKQLEALGYIDG